MSFHIYIARDKFKDSPISPEEWFTAATKCDELFIENKNRKGQIYTIAKLKADKQQRLDITPYGLVHAQNPSKELVAVMFKLADFLNARVYSEKLKPYESVDDWEKRTQHFRDDFVSRRNKYRSEWYKQKLFWLIMAIFIGIIFVVVNFAGSTY